MVKREFTAIYKKKGKRYVAWIEEIPGVNTQGKTKIETKENLKEALALILAANRKITAQQTGKLVSRESLRVGVPA